MANRSKAARSRRAELEAKRLAQKQKERRIRIIATVSGLVVVAAIAIVTVLALQQRTTGEQLTPTHSATGYEGNDGLSLNTTVNEGAPTLDIYSDFQCPNCKILEDALSDTIKEIIDDGSAKIVFHNMTFLDQVNSTTNLESSTRATVGAACADLQGYYLDYFTEVFANQPETEGDGYDDTLPRETIPATIGLADDALTQFQACYNDQQTLDFVDGVNAQASEAGVTSTPQYHLNGEDITNTLGNSSDIPAALKKLIQTATK